MIQHWNEANLEEIALRIALIQITDRNTAFGRGNLEWISKYGYESPNWPVCLRSQCNFSLSCYSPLLHFDHAYGQNGVWCSEDFRDSEDDNSEGNYDLQDAFQPPSPPSGYVCNSCNLPGHYIRFCPKDSNKTSTSYQGPRRSVGQFECTKCKRKWTSSNSFAGQWQKCKKCHVQVRPKKQYAMEKAVEKGLMPKKRHAMRTSSVSSEVTVTSSTSSLSYTPSASPQSEWSKCSTPTSNFAFTF